MAVACLLALASGARAQRHPVESQKSLIASANGLASRASLEILQQDDNAVDAAIATGLALAMTYARAGNLCGGGLLVVRLADGRPSAIDFPKTAPSGAHRSLFLDDRGGLAAGGSLTSIPLGAGATAPAESHETTHYPIVDSAGNAVAVTHTVNGLYGNGATAAGTGILLNNEMDDFTAKVGVKNIYGLIQGEANAIAPNKRPLSSMTPTIVVREGSPFLVTASPGGPTIISTTLLVVTNMIDHQMSITQAVDAPRFHHQWQPDVINHEPFLTSSDTAALLKALGHTLATRSLYPNAPEAAARSWGDAESILIEGKTGLNLGASDLRNADSAAVGW